MRLRIRTLILAFVVLASFSTSASACCLFAPFRALFGCGCPGYGYGPQPGYAPQGYGCYQPSYPGVMSPCGPCCGPCPLVEVFRVPRCLPMPAIFQQCLDPCGMQQCAAPMMPAPMVAPPMAQYQPMPMMQQQFFAPQVMQAPQMEMGCDSGCGGEMPMPGMAPQMQMMAPQAMGMSTATDDSCCGDEGMMSYDGGFQGWNGAPAMAWTPQSVYPGVGFPTRAYNPSLPPSGFGVFGRPRVARREARRMQHQMQHQMRRSQHRQPYPVMGYPSYGAMPGAYGYPQQMQPMQPFATQPFMGQTTMPQTQSWTMPSAPMTTQWSPQMSPGYSGAGYAGPSYAPMPAPMQPAMMPAGPQVAGDIMGDHEEPRTSAALAPVVPNSFRGLSTFTNASFSRPFLGSASQYQKSVR